jgi:anti-sigma regulatory factor (Ser/Thr protein kinase)
MAIATPDNATDTEAGDHVANGARVACLPDGEVIATFSAELGAPALARHAVADALRGLGYGDPLVGDATLVVSELAANAVRHARSSFSVIIGANGTVLRVAVEDTGTSASADALGMIARPMRGLGLIEAVSARWGIEPSAGGKLVWAELAMPSSGADA